MRRLLTILPILILVASCIPDPLPVGKIPQLKPKIVVTSQLLSDTSVVVLLTQSFGALEANGDTDPEVLLDLVAINDATVIIEGGGELDTLTFVETGIYTSFSFNFQDETFYTLRINSPSLGTVVAATQCKTAVFFESVEAEIYDTGFDTLATITYSMQDIPDKNYYMINIQNLTEEDDDDYDVINPTIFTHLKEDEPNSDGQLLSESFKVFFRRDFIPGDTIMVQLGNISKGYFDFLKLREDTRFSFADFVGEPVNYPTNVQGGLGWFTLHLPDVQFITVDE
jgi:hypothetical protein